MKIMKEVGKTVSVGIRGRKNPDGSPTYFGKRPG